ARREARQTERRRGIQASRPVLAAAGFIGGRIVTRARLPFLPSQDPAAAAPIMLTMLLRFV
ncbi:MAG TPA: hypothetical protein VLT61_14355, partial [Anaeromyxobacteraceae bacterium]|nr:hypothetical protein [Anaeromyxobacteraceae bacterium]